MSLRSIAKQPAEVRVLVSVMTPPPGGLPRSRLSTTLRVVLGTLAWAVVLLLIFGGLFYRP